MLLQVSPGPRIWSGWHSVGAMQAVSASAIEHRLPGDPFEGAYSPAPLRTLVRIPQSQCPKQRYDSRLARRGNESNAPSLGFPGETHPLDHDSADYRDPENDRSLARRGLLFARMFCRPPATTVNAKRPPDRL
jgi:hypothetical protein